MWPLLIVLTFQSPPTRHVILHEAERVHAAELASSRATAFVGGAAELTSRRAGTKLAFDAHHVGESYVGPDLEALGPAAADVHASTQAVLTRAECMSIRREAQTAMAQGKSSDFTYTDLASLGEVHVKDLPAARRLLRRKLASSLFPAVADLYGLEEKELRVIDAVVVRYDAARQATRQPMHRDEALVSFNIPLSDESEYEGGGTSFEGSGAVLRPPMGRLLRLRLVERAVCTHVRAHRPMRPPGVVPPRAKLAPPAGPGKPLM